MKRFATVCIVLAGLTGCVSSSTMSRVMSYPPTSTTVQMADDAYRVFEHKTDKTLMTTPSIGKSVGMGVAKGATLGLASVSAMSPEQKHEAAAHQYLNQTGRSNCKITKGYLLAEPQYEFTYECANNGDRVGNG